MEEYKAKESLIIRPNETHDVVTTEQELGDDFWNELADAKEKFEMRLDGYTPVASIPEALANKWLREGFDVWNAPANEIVKKLKMENYDKFVISGDTKFDH